MAGPRLVSGHQACQPDGRSVKIVLELCPVPLFLRFHSSIQDDAPPGAAPCHHQKAAPKPPSEVARPSEVERSTLRRNDLRMLECFEYCSTCTVLQYCTVLYSTTVQLYCTVLVQCLQRVQYTCAPLRSHRGPSRRLGPAGPDARTAGSSLEKTRRFQREALETLEAR